MDVEKEIGEIKKRNQKVELDKAWETSATRRLSIATFTYVLAVIWLYAIQNQNPFLNAIVPAGGYLVSTLTLPLIKKWWQK